jgi:hypothetical protein
MTDDIESTRSSPKIIALAGRKGSGKDTALDVLQRLGGRHDAIVRPVAFADPLKRAVDVMFREASNIDFTSALYGPSHLRESTVAFGSTEFSVRHALQTLGTEWGRKHLGPNVWVDLALEEARNLSPRAVAVITDARFENEFQRIRAAGGQIWLIDRPEPEEPTMARAFATWLRRHRSERSFYWPHVARQYADVVIDNSGSLETFKQSVAALGMRLF